jgi:hypothetical protein
METVSVRRFQPFSETMSKYRHEIKHYIDSAYITCHESDPTILCENDGCPFFEGNESAGCQLHHLLDLFSETQ